MVMILFPSFYRKPRDVCVQFYRLSREGATDVGGAERATARLRSPELFGVHLEFASN